jgi:hypothetical protein
VDLDNGPEPGAGHPCSEVPAPAVFASRLARTVLVHSYGGLRLPAETRRVLVLHEYADMAVPDLAAALGCSPGAAKVRLHRARRRLSEICRAGCIADREPDGSYVCEPRGGTPAAQVNATFRGPRTRRA